MICYTAPARARIRAAADADIYVSLLLLPRVISPPLLIVTARICCCCAYGFMPCIICCAMSVTLRHAYFRCQRVAYAASARYDYLMIFTPPLLLRDVDADAAPADAAALLPDTPFFDDAAA